MSTTRMARHGFGTETASTERAIDVFLRPVDDADGTVVMVHGTLDRGGSFTRMVRRIEGLDAVAYDRRGYQSSRSLGGAAALSDHVEDLESIFGALRNPGPITLVGHSFGGVIALATALALPGDVSSVIVYEPPMPWLWEGGHPHRGVPIDGDPADEVEQFFRRMVSDAAWDHLAESERADRIADGAGLVSDIQIIRSETPFTLEALETFVVPMTIVIGATATGHRLAAERVVATAANGTLLSIEGAPHGAHLSHPDTLAEIVMRHAARNEDHS